MTNEEAYQRGRRDADEEWRERLRHYLAVAAGSPDPLVGLLHDAVEDGWATTEEIARACGDLVAFDVEALTRRGGEAYADYIDRVAQRGGLAVRVKIADLLDNLARCDEKSATLRDRYVRALASLDDRVEA